MSKKQCANCYYNNLCNSDEICDEYYPIGETSADDSISDSIESKRISFRNEWFKYIEEFYN